jgi:hypothetical protein
VTLVLDAGGVSALAGDRYRLQALRQRGLWPPQVPSIVLAEALTGDHRRDFHAHRLLRACQIRVVDELLSREAARLRTATGRAATISAVDAAVGAYAGSRDGSVVVSSDPGDLRALGEHTSSPITVFPV